MTKINISLREIAAWQICLWFWGKEAGRIVHDADNGYKDDAKS